MVLANKATKNLFSASQKIEYDVANRFFVLNAQSIRAAYHGQPPRGDPVVLLVDDLI